MCGMKPIKAICKKCKQYEDPAFGFVGWTCGNFHLMPDDEIPNDCPFALEHLMGTQSNAE